MLDSIRSEIKGHVYDRQSWWTHDIIAHAAIKAKATGLLYDACKN